MTLHCVGCSRLIEEWEVPEEERNFALETNHLVVCGDCTFLEEILLDSSPSLLRCDECGRTVENCDTLEINMLVVCEECFVVGAAWLRGGVESNFCFSCGCPHQGEQNGLCAACTNLELTYRAHPRGTESYHTSDSLPSKKDYQSTSHPKVDRATVPPIERSVSRSQEHTRKETGCEPKVSTSASAASDPQFTCGKNRDELIKGEEEKATTIHQEIETKRLAAEPRAGRTKERITKPSEHEHTRGTRESTESRPRTPVSQKGKGSNKQGNSRQKEKSGCLNSTLLLLFGLLPPVVLLMACFGTRGTMEGDAWLGTEHCAMRSEETSEVRF